MGRKTRLTNIAPIKWTMPRAEDIVQIANAAAERIGISTRLETSDIVNHDDYIGERYGVATEGGIEAMKMLARSEAILTDPVYSAKALAALIDHVRKGQLAKSETAVFIHTGGTPALFAYSGDLGL